MKLSWMQSGSLSVLLLIAVALGGCRSAHTLQFNTSTTPHPAAAAFFDVAHGPAPPRAASVGQLAYIGSDGNVYVTTADGQSTVAVTNDAEAPPERQGLSYHRVAWSPNGWLAFAAVNREGNKARGTLYVLESAGGPARLVAESDEHFISYIYWSPAPCPGRPDCQRLAYLVREGPEIGLHLVEIDARGIEDRLLAVGRPFFFSWSTDGHQILWYTCGADGGSTHPHLTLYDVEQDHAEVLPHTPGSGLAPPWSGTGKDWLVVSSEGGKNQLQSAGPAGTVTLITSTNDEIVYALSPSGEQVAYAVRESGEEHVYGPIHVFDSQAGWTRQVTKNTFRILAFFWSPDGRRLAYLTRLDLPNAVATQWRTIDIVDGQDRGFAAFDPSPWMWHIVAGFGQYAQSSRFWSPDGRYLVYSDRDEANVDRVWMVDTWAEKGARPIPVAKGVIGFWSWN